MDLKFALAPTGAMETVYLVGVLQYLQMDGDLYPPCPSETSGSSYLPLLCSVALKFEYSESELSRKHGMWQKF